VRGDRRQPHGSFLTPRWRKADSNSQSHPRRARFRNRFPPHIFSEIQWQGDPTIAAASSMQIVIIGLLILVVQRIFRLRLVV
jgi:hypothetical protein